MMNTLRGAWRSWTVRVNSIVAAIALGLPSVLDAFPQMKAFLPENIYMYVLGALTFANILLRFKTDKPLDQR